MRASRRARARRPRPRCGPGRRRPHDDRHRRPAGRLAGRLPPAQGARRSARGPPLLDGDERGSGGGGGGGFDDGAGGHRGVRSTSTAAGPPEVALVEEVPMTVWKKAMSYLGLGPDDAYDDYDLPPEPERAPRSPSRSNAGYPPDQDYGVRAVPRQ